MMKALTAARPVQEELSDALLLDGVRSGDQQAFETLFLRYRGPIGRLVLTLVGDPQEAEDLTQEVFLRLHRRPLGGSREHNLRGWLYRVATNLGYNALRARHRRQKP